MTDYDALCARMKAYVASDASWHADSDLADVLLLTEAQDAIAALVARVDELTLDARGAFLASEIHLKRAHAAEARVAALEADLKNARTDAEVWDLSRRKWRASAEAAEARVKELEATVSAASAAGSSRPSSPE